MSPLNRTMVSNSKGSPPIQIGLGEKLDVHRALITSTHMLDLMVEQPSHISEIVAPNLLH